LCRRESFVFGLESGFELELWAIGLVVAVSIFWILHEFVYNHKTSPSPLTLWVMSYSILILIMFFSLRVQSTCFMIGTCIYPKFWIKRQVNEFFLDFFSARKYMEHTVHENKLQKVCFKAFDLMLECKFIAGVNDNIIF